MLHLGISGERNWKLSSLLSHLTLNSLKITSTSILYLEDCIAIGELLSPSRCPKNVIIEIDQKFCITKTQPAVKEKPSSDQNSASALVEMEIFDDQNKDYMGYCITRSYCQWMLTVTNMTAESSSRLYNNAGVMDLCEDKAKNVTKHKLPRFSVLTKSLNTLFTDMKHMLSLEELSLELPVDCSCIAWPDLSRLRVLHLKIKGDRNWKLSYLLEIPHFTLESIIITASSDSILCLEDCIAIGEMLSPSRCPKNVVIAIDQKLCITKTQPAITAEPSSVEKELKKHFFPTG